ncbi:MAG: hypothetical protein LBR53_09930 [Deltaproteobacteria bacterium]|jgi:hypothetical protein|nr:hypothetical protein [Deltaproteobacteria bacterium]
MASFYAPSGLYQPRAIFLTPLATAVVSAALGALYAAFLVFRPEIFFKIPLLALWGFLSIVLSKWSIKINSIRAPLKAAVLVFIGSLAGYYVHLCFYCALASAGKIVPGVTPFELSLIGSSFSFEAFKNFISGPGELLEGVKRYYVFGFPDPSGIRELNPLYALVWLVEFVLYDAFIVVMGYVYAGEPYEEDMGDWLIKRKLERPFVTLPEDSKQASIVFNRLAEGDVSYFLTSRPEKKLKGSFLGLELFYSEGAPDACVTVRHYVKTLKRSSKTTVLEYLMIPEVQAERLMKRLD